jgi:hypothetical protein
MSRITNLTCDVRFRPTGERIAVEFVDQARTLARGCLATAGISGLTAVIFIAIGDSVGVMLALPLFALGGVAGMLALASGVFGAGLGAAANAARAALAVVQRRRLQGPRGRDSASVCGRAVALRTVRSPSGQTVIAFRTRFTRRGRGPEIEGAEAFWLDDGAPDPLLVDVEHLHLAGALRPALPGGTALPADAIDLLPSRRGETDRRELLLQAGDYVQVTGWLSEEVDPTMSTHARGVPVRRVLRGTPHLPLTVRRRSPPAAPSG